MFTSYLFSYQMFVCLFYTITLLFGIAILGRFLWALIFRFEDITKRLTCYALGIMFAALALLSLAITFGGPAL